MKLLVFALFSCMSFAVVRAQDKTDEVWLRLDRDIHTLGSDVTGIALYDVHDIARSMIEAGIETETTDEQPRKGSGGRTDLVPEGKPIGPVTGVRLTSGNATAPTDPAEIKREAQLTRATNALAELIKANMEPAFDPKLESINIASSGTLAIVATGAQHAWLGRFFALAKLKQDLVQVETRWVMGPRGSFEKLGLKTSSTLQTQDEHTALLKKLEDDRTGVDEFDQLLAPKLVTYNLQRATISTLDEIAYVKEWHVTFVQPGPQEIADPLVETIKTGEILKLRPVRIDVNLYRLALEVEHVAVAQPIPTKKVRVSVAPGGEAEVGLPVITRVNFSADVKLAAGAAVVLVTPLDDKQDMALIVKLSRYAGEPLGEPVPERK